MNASFQQCKQYMGKYRVTVKSKSLCYMYDHVGWLFCEMRAKLDVCLRVVQPWLYMGQLHIFMCCYQLIAINNLR